MPFFVFYLAAQMASSIMPLYQKKIAYNAVRQTKEPGAK